MQEKWKNIEIEGIYPYQISNKGRVKSLKKIVNYSDGRKRNYPEAILKPRLDTKGYFQVQLYGELINIERRVHQLVGRAFIENLENKICINHKDGNRQNNNLDNLEWVTHSENTLDAIKRGSIYNPSKKITEEQVDKIRKSYQNSNLTQWQIGKLFGLKQAQISRIVNNKNWI